MNDLKEREIDQGNDHHDYDHHQHCDHHQLANLSQDELSQLLQAKLDLEDVPLSIRLTSAIGSPIEKGIRMLPDGWKGLLDLSVHKALERAIRMATMTLGKGIVPSSNRFHQVFVGMTGAVGGAFGLGALPLELPISTTLILRSIADISRSEGHDLNEVETQLACLEVFALGNQTENKRDDYWITRKLFALGIEQAAVSIAKKGLTKGVVSDLVNIIAARFGFMVSKQVLAKAIPFLGAAGGSAINLIFIRHFQRMARGHFIVKRLEKKHGRAPIEAMYRSVAIRVKSKEMRSYNSKFESEN